MKIEDLLKLLGVENEIIANITSEKEEDRNKVKAEDVANSITEKYKARLKNDQSFIDPLHAELTGKISGTVQNKIAKKVLGMTESELNALPKEKLMDTLIDMTIKKISDAKGDKTPDDKDKEIEKLNNKLLKKDEELKKVREEEIPSLQRKQVDFENGYRFKEEISSELDKHKIIVGKKAALTIVNSFIAERADVKFTEDGKHKLMQKGSDVELFENNTQVKLGDLVKQAVESEKLIQLSNGGGGEPDPKKKTITVEDDGKVLNLHGEEAAKEKLEEMKKLTTKK